MIQASRLTTGDRKKNIRNVVVRHYILYTIILGQDIKTVWSLLAWKQIPFEKKNISRLL